MIKNTVDHVRSMSGQDTELEESYGPSNREHPRNIRTYAFGRDEVLDEDGAQIAKWAGAKPDRKQRADTLSAELRELILNWWSERTRVSPVAKKVLKRENHAIQTLDVSQTQFYKEFLEKNRTVMVNGIPMPVKVGQTKFCSLKPRWVKKEVDRYICCCKYHVELMYLLQALNEIRFSHGGAVLWPWRVLQMQER
ncbi:hypothetical protein R1sor_024660 [Riccia sorocarpa]|uniref:Uncharacterized protein n=1 Tax=Riccia sorocarpa TaxID=122646 RepID=A0ABD3GTK4_9MARC